jgi:molybdate transport system permease protein
VIGLIPHSWLNDLAIPPWVWNPLSISLHAAFEATIVVAIAGVALGYLLAKGRFPGRDVIETVFSLPMALPPTVVGYYLLTRLGGPGPIRTAEIHLFGHPLTFTFTGIVVAQIVESFPYCLRFSRTAITDVDPRFEQAARAMGLSRWRVALLVTLPLARRGIVAGVAMAFGRALGDFGATMIVAGSVPMATTMPIALYNAVFFGTHEHAMVLAFVQLGVAFIILLGVSRLGRVRRDDTAQGITSLVTTRRRAI